VVFAITKKFSHKQAFSLAFLNKKKKKDQESSFFLVRVLIFQIRVQIFLPL